MESSKQGVEPISNAIRGLDFLDWRLFFSSIIVVIGFFLSSSTTLVPMPALLQEDSMSQWVEDVMVG